MKANAARLAKEFSAREVWCRRKTHCSGTFLSGTVRLRSDAFKTSGHEYLGDLNWPLNESHHHC
ncbi:hypothetical protein, partial [Acaryochloris sp. IP29b_bin.137]|uniref:hypothetical protein n=1 Tax=Acaryochloris sp. IP29b_bin.137 TaxID=2969217 RepID=UPI002633667F